MSPNFNGSMKFQRKNAIGWLVGGWVGGLVGGWVG